MKLTSLIVVGLLLGSISSFGQEEKDARVEPVMAGFSLFRVIPAQGEAKQQVIYSDEVVVVVPEAEAKRTLEALSDNAN